ncbi:MAG: hypothetical protein WD992_01925 [Candidatus Levyibacteriota bacterium]
MQYILIFLIELSILFLFSKSLTKTLSRALFFITKSRAVVATVVALLFFPGVVIHELSHMFAAGILFVPVGNIDLLPKLKEDGELRLGSVMIGKTDIVRRALIGIAPLLVGLGVVLGIPFLLKDQATFLYSAVAVYLLFEVGNTMFSSKKDLEGILELVVVLAILVLTLYIANLRWPIDAFVSLLNTEPALRFFNQINTFLLWTLVIDVVAIAVLKLVVLGANKRQSRS